MKHIPFGEKEYARRVDLVKERMDHRGIEVLLVLDPSHMNYLTGFDGWSFYVHQGLVISLKDEYPSWFGRAQDSNAARMTTYLPEDHIYGYKDEYVQSRYIHTMEFVAGMIKGKGKTPGDRDGRILVQSEDVLCTSERTSLDEHRRQ